MQRINDTFSKLRAVGKPALITFLTAGDPDLDTSLRLMHEVVAAGADIVELGVPFSDPMADGPVIQRSSERALGQDITLNRVLGMVKAFRISNTETPIILMGYTNPIEAFGFQNFVNNACEVGVDGVLTVDSPPEECAEFSAILKQAGIAPIFLIAPTTTEKRMAEIASLAEGFIYYVSLRGITGAMHVDLRDVKAHIALLRKYTTLPIGVGFGISTPAMAAQAGRIGDAVVVGTRIVQEIEAFSPIPIQTRIRDLVAEMRAAMREYEEERENACM
jgi:tryptophan synthase alpha chain